MIQLEPQLKQFCEKADFLKMVVKAKTSATEPQAEALRKLNISVGVALNDLKSAEASLMRGGTRRRHKKARKTRRR